MTQEWGHTWKKPGGMGPPGMASLGGMLPITGLGAAAALWKTQTDEFNMVFNVYMHPSLLYPNVYVHDAALANKRQQGAVAAPAFAAPPTPFKV